MGGRVGSARSTGAEKIIEAGDVGRTRESGGKTTASFEREQRLQQARDYLAQKALLSVPFFSSMGVTRYFTRMEYRPSAAGPFAEGYTPETTTSISPQEAATVSDLVKRNYSLQEMNRTPLDLEDLPKGDDALCIVGPSGLEVLKSKNQLYNNALIIEGSSGTVFRYKATSNKRSGLLIPFELSPPSASTASTAEARLALRLGRPAAEVRRQYQEALQEFRTGRARWSETDLIILVNRLTEGAEGLTSFDKSLHEAVYYQRMARERRWTPAQTRGFLLEFIGQRQGNPSLGGNISFGDYFAHRLSHALQTLRGREVSPEFSVSLLLRLAKNDPSLWSWQSLPWLLERLDSLSPTVAMAAEDGMLATRTIFERLEIAPEHFGDLLAKLAEREGAVTGEAYPYLAEALSLREYGSTEQNALALGEFLSKTSLPASRMADWVRLSPEQRVEFFKTMENYDQVSELAPGLADWEMFSRDWFANAALDLLLEDAVEPI